jgi:signal transduction histidine kinase
VRELDTASTDPLGGKSSSAVARSLATRDPRSIAVALIGDALVALGVLVTVGWITGTRALLLTIPEAGAPFRPGLAIGLLLCGLALHLRCAHRDRAADALAILVLLEAGIVGLSHLVPGLRVAGTEIVPWDPVAALLAPGSEMSLNGALGLGFFGVGLLLARRGSLAARLGGWTTALLGGVAVVGYLLEVPDAAGWAGGGRIAFAAGLAFLFGGVGLSMEATRRQRKNVAPRTRLAPYAAGAVVLIAGAIFWRILVVHEEDNLVDVTRLAATEIAAEMGVGARTLISGLSITSAVTGTPSEAEMETELWQARGRLLLSRFPDLLAVELFDASGQPLVRVTRPDAEVPPPESPLPHVDGSWASPGFRVGEDSAVRLVVPLSDGRSLAGTVAVGAFVESALTREDRLHSITASEGETVLYQNRPPPPGIPIVRMPLRLASAGAEWGLSVAGATALADAVRSPLPDVAFGLAAVIAMLVVLMMRAANAEHRKAAELAALNERLELEIGEKRRAEADLRSLNRSLDERVRERTSALANAVDQLAAENRARRRVLDHLERMNASLRQFDGFISHELRQPLGALQIWIDLIDSGTDLSEKKKGYIGKARAEIRRMAKMIENELRLSKATHGEAPTEPVALTPLLGALLNDLAPRLTEANGQVEVEELPSVFVDPDQARQVFGNLLENAVKYRRPDVPLRVRIEHDREARTDGLCEIRVRDNGRGFDSDSAEKLFDSFRRATEDQAGSGLGLAICRRIVEHHGGSIHAEGAPDQGATFVVRLPMAT